LAGIELVEDKARKLAFDAKLNIGARMARKLMDEGMINRGILNSLCFSPPLVVTEADVDEMVEKFGRALAAMADELVAAGEWAAP
jgi:4-aminobutyrate--pyruvate transaminase